MIAPELDSQTPTDRLTAAENKVAAGLALAAQIEAEALHSYRKPPDRLDPTITVRRIRHALGLTQ